MPSFAARYRTASTNVSPFDFITKSIALPLSWQPKQ
jgi:hypothetical protein